VTNYANAAAAATRALRKNGQVVTRRASTAGTYDPTAGTAANTTADTPRFGAAFDFDLQQAGATLQNGALIQQGDKRLLLDATGPVLMTDHYIIGGVEYTVVNIKEVNPAGTPVLFDLHLRT
jgi:uncharacterized protein with GYD domain